MKMPTLCGRSTSAEAGQVEDSTRSFTLRCYNIIRAIVKIRAIITTTQNPYHRMRSHPQRCANECANYSQCEESLYSSNSTSHTPTPKLRCINLIRQPRNVPSMNQDLKSDPNRKTRCNEIITDESFNAGRPCIIDESRCEMVSLDVTAAASTLENMLRKQCQT